MHFNTKDVTGQRFGRLQVLWPVGHIGTYIAWVAQCDCGNVIIRSSMVIRRRGKHNLQSCGCAFKEWPKGNKFSLTHGLSRTPEYVAFVSAKQRCTVPAHPEWKNYGGRGIEFRFKSFEQFISEIGLKPHPELSVDRINNEGHYESGNVRWATRVQQSANRRPRIKGYKHKKKRVYKNA